MDERPGGDVESIEGRSSRLRCALKCENGSLVGSMWFA